MEVRIAGTPARLRLVRHVGAGFWEVRSYGSIGDRLGALVGRLRAWLGL